MGKAKSAGRLLAKMMLPGKIDPKVISRAGTLFRDELKQLGPPKFPIVRPNRNHALLFRNFPILAARTWVWPSHAPSRSIRRSTPAMRGDIGGSGRPKAARLRSGNGPSSKCLPKFLCLSWSRL